MIGGAALLALAALNADLLAFFIRRRGVLFTLGVMPLYWMYLIICGLGFGLGLVTHLAGRRAT
jgi:hypothetical protein